jgi:hypothetical protein
MHGQSLIGDANDRQGIFHVIDRRSYFLGRGVTSCTFHCRQDCDAEVGMSASEAGPQAPRALDIRMCSLVLDRRPKFANFHGTRALLLVLALDDPLANAFLFPDREKTVKILPLVFSRFIDLIGRLILSMRVCPSAHRKTWLLEERSDYLPFKTVPAISKNLALRILARQRRELRRVHQIQHLTFVGIIEGVGSCSSQVY